MTLRTGSALVASDRQVLADQLTALRRDIEKLQRPNGILINGKWSISVNPANQLTATWIETGAETVLASPS